MTIRWVLDLAFVKNVCIGRIHQLPAESGPPKGVVRKQPPWAAWGMLSDWQDTALGKHHESREQAQAAVIEWYEDRRLKYEQRIKTPCSAHAEYRAGCVMCEAVNNERRLV